MHIKKVIEGLTHYIDKHIYPDMNTLQQVGYLTLVETLTENPEVLTGYLHKNILLRMLLSVDKDGEVNVDRLRSALHRVADKSGDIELNIPMYGKFKLESNDIDEILKYVSEAEHETDSQSY